MSLAQKLAYAQEMIEAMEKAGQISVLNWLYCCDDELPDDDTTVFVAIEGETELIFAFHQCEDWFFTGSLEKIIGVYAWAHIPALPPLPKPLANEEGPKS